MPDLFDALDTTPTLGDIQRHAERLARATDPETSKAAAERMVDTGKLGRMAQLTWDYLRLHGPCTSKELESRSGYTDGALRKRLNDLRTADRARVIMKRKCEITGEMAQVWEAV